MEEIFTVLWDWNVKAYDLPGKLEAAVAGGFDILTVPYRVFRPLIDGGMPARSILSMADASGVTLDFLDGMTSWGSTRYPPGSEFLKAALDFSVDDALRLCNELGVRQIVAIAGFDGSCVPSRSQIVDEFARFCDRMASEGIWVELEPVAFLGINTLGSAWAIVQEADRPNSGITFDTWHVARAHEDLDVLRAIPAGRVRNIQLVDGTQEPNGEDVWDDLFARVLPGEGELDLVSMLKSLRLRHEVAYVGPEAIDARLDMLAPRDLGVRANDATRHVLTAAGFTVPTAHPD
jgi:sugar phosphate isomerase/epimerase